MTTYLDTKAIAPIARMLSYRKRQFALTVTTRVTLQDLNWSGGTRSEYHAIRLADLATASPQLSVRPPWDNPAEGTTVEIPAGVAIARTGHFCGKPYTMTLYVRPENAPLLLG